MGIIIEEASANSTTILANPPLVEAASQETQMEVEPEQRIFSAPVPTSQAEEITLVSPPLNHMPGHVTYQMPSMPNASLAFPQSQVPFATHVIEDTDMYKAESDDEAYPIVRRALDELWCFAQKKDFPAYSKLAAASEMLKALDIIYQGISRTEFADTCLEYASQSGVSIALLDQHVSVLGTFLELQGFGKGHFPLEFLPPQIGMAHRANIVLRRERDELLAQLKASRMEGAPAQILDKLQSIDNRVKALGGQVNALSQTPGGLAGPSYAQATASSRAKSVSFQEPTRDPRRPPPPPSPLSTELPSGQDTRMASPAPAAPTSKDKGKQPEKAASTTMGRKQFLSASSIVESMFGPGAAPVTTGKRPAPGSGTSESRPDTPAEPPAKKARKQSKSKSGQKSDGEISEGQSDGTRKTHPAVPTALLDPKTGGINLQAWTKTGQIAQLVPSLSFAQAAQLGSIMANSSGVIDLVTPPGSQLGKAASTATPAPPVAAAAKPKRQVQHVAPPLDSTKVLVITFIAPVLEADRREDVAIQSSVARALQFNPEGASLNPIQNVRWFHDQRQLHIRFFTRPTRSEIQALEGKLDLWTLDNAAIQSIELYGTLTQLRIIQCPRLDPDSSPNARDRREYTMAEMWLDLTSRPENQWIAERLRPFTLNPRPKWGMCTQYAQYADLIVTITDTHAGEWARRFTKDSKWLRLFKSRCSLEIHHPGKEIPLCTRCWRYGHSAKRCNAPTQCCRKCGEAHVVSDHQQFASCCVEAWCKAQVFKVPMPPCPASHASCPNCGKVGHPPASTKCKYQQQASNAAWHRENKAVINARDAVINAKKVETKRQALLKKLRETRDEMIRQGKLRPDGTYAPVAGPSENRFEALAEVDQPMNGEEEDRGYLSEAGALLITQESARDEEDDEQNVDDMYA